jgi:hypothetical protein
MSGQFSESRAKLEPLREIVCTLTRARVADAATSMCADPRVTNVRSTSAENIFLSCRVGDPPLA